MKRKYKGSLSTLMLYLLIFAVCAIVLIHIVNLQTASDFESKDMQHSEYSAFDAILARYPRLKTILGSANVNPKKVSRFLQDFTRGAMWIFLAQQEFYPHDLVDTSSEIVDKSKQHGMVYFRPGLFKPCHYLVSADGKSQRYRHIKGYESRLYIVRRVSPLSARVLPDFGPNSCMPDDKSPPVVIMPGTYAAVTFDAVFLQRELFWMAVIHHLDALDLKPKQRLSLFIQRLLWETDHQLIIIPPSSTLSGARMSSAPKKSTDNEQCNTNEVSGWGFAKSFMSKLSKIKCTYHHSTFLECALELVDTVFSGSGSEYVNLRKTLAMWFKALDYFGYEFPKRFPFTRDRLKEKRWGIPAIYSPPKSNPYYQLHAFGSKHAKTEDISRDELTIKDEENVAIGLFENENSEIIKKPDLSGDDVSIDKSNEAATGILDLLHPEQDGDVENEFTSHCRSVNTTYKPTIPQKFKFDDIVLIVVFNFPYLASHIPKLLTMYGRHFKHILFCGEKIHTLDTFYSAQHGVPVSFVQISHQQGHWAYGCAAAAIKMGYNTSGFLQISDDMLLNVWNLQDLPRDKPWFQSRVRVADVRMRRLPDIATTSRWFPWIFGAGRLAAQLTIRTLRQLTQDQTVGAKVQGFIDQLTTTSGCGDCLMYEASDIFYIPNWMKDDYVFFADLFHHHRLHLELAIPTILFGLAQEHAVVRLRGNYLWGEGPRAQFLKFYSPHDHFQHAWKLTRLADQSGDGGGGLRFFCRVFLPHVDGDLVETTVREHVVDEKDTDRKTLA